MRKFIAIMTLIMVLISTNLIYAEDLVDERIIGEDYGVRFVSLTSVSASLSLDSSNASVSSSAKANSSYVDRIVITANLMQLLNGRWVTIKTWRNDVSGSSANLYENTNVTRGYEYKVVSDIHTYRNGSFVESERTESNVKSN